jgi:very-short-patch-repair endonuclease
VGKQYAIFPQLPLWMLIESESKDAKAARAFNNRINLKRVDFVLVDSSTQMPYIPIELDDRSHEREDRHKRDAFVDEVLQQAGIKLVRIRAAANYNPQMIRTQLGLAIPENVSA